MLSKPNESLAVIARLAARTLYSIVSSPSKRV
jgi:hypothetical protein